MTYISRKASKRGNSMQVCIPSEIIKQLNIKSGDSLRFYTSHGDIIIRSPAFGSLKANHDKKVREENGTGWLHLL